jgi:hypothetical protein
LGTLWERIRITSLDRDLIGIHRENKGRVDQELHGRKLLTEVQEQNMSWKGVKKMTKIESTGENL